MIRKGSLVSFFAPMVSDHPIYSQAVGKRFKVADVFKRNGKIMARLDGGPVVPAILCQGIAQKKSKGTVLASAR